jgi:DNA invertase Pin-like site-specific DNA recombinase
VPRPAPMQAGIDAKRAAGGRVGGPAPYGWRWAGSELLPVQNEQAVRFLVLHLRARGLSLQAIADELARLQLPMRSGAPWRRDALHRIAQAPDLEATG